MMKRSSAVGVVSCLVLGAFGASCASGGTTRPRLPDEEHALLELMPNDAFLGLRVDMRALRATPHWQALEESMTASGAPEETQRYFRDTDRMVAVMGGFIDAPSYPEPDPEAEYVTPPAWVPVAQSLHGKLPRAVAVIEGQAAALCDEALEGQARREVRGYQLGVLNGVAMLRRDRICVVTLEPVLDSLLTQASGPPSDVLGMLAAAGPGEAAPIFSYVADYAAPGYAAWVEQHGERARAELDEARERRRQEEAAREAAVAAGQTETVDGEGMPEFGDFAAAMEDMINQTIVLFLEVSKITMRGMESSTIRISHNEGGYDFRSRVVISDENRSIMWRELLRMYIEIANAAVQVYDIPDEPREVLTAALRAVHVDDHSDGYEVVARASDTRVSSLIAYARRSSSEIAPAISDVGIESPWELISHIDTSTYQTPADILLTLEPNVERIQGLDDRDTRKRGLIALSGAYVSLGRYQDAVNLLTTSIAGDRAHADTVEYYMRPDVFMGMCGLAATLCEHHLAWGFAEEARTAATMAADQGQTCADLSYPAFACYSVAEAQLGRGEQALAELEGRSWGDADVTQFGAARAQVLGTLGRWDASFEAARGTCVGPLSASSCPGAFAYALEALSRGGTTLEQNDVTFANVRASYPGVDSANRADDAVASAAVIADCARRVRLAPREADTLATCTAAHEVSVRLHGTAHARTAQALMLLTAARTAAGDTAGAATSQQELDALRPSLGPQHPTNQPPPVVSTPRPRPRPRPR